MVFWNRKKKRTTAKPKINASVPKPKANNEKQESSIPPHPKKMDIPKPDKLSKNKNVRKEFLKTFHQLTYRHRPWDVWRDFIIMFACSLSNPVDKSHYEEREKRYLKIIKKYNKQEQKTVSRTGCLCGYGFGKQSRAGLLRQCFYGVESR